MGIPFYPSLFSPSEEDGKDDDRRWEETKRLLQANPQIINVELLLSVLKQQPPIYVVEFFLSHPLLDLTTSKLGPTPLQLAVTEGCDIQIVELLIQACPWALCVTSVAEPEDPLSLAKRLGKPQELLELLQRPLVQWLEESSSSSSYLRNHNQQNQQQHPTLLHGSVLQQQQQHQEQQEDMANVKLLCARLMKRNQQLSKEIKLCQTTIVQQAIKPTTSREEKTPIDDNSKAKTTTRIAELEILLEEQAALNEVMRNDLEEWKQGMMMMMLEQQKAQSQRMTILRQVEEEEAYQDDDDENNHPSTSDNNNKKHHHASRRRLLSDRPKRKSVCRPFNSILLNKHEDWLTPWMFRHQC